MIILLLVVNELSNSRAITHAVNTACLELGSRLYDKHEQCNSTNVWRQLVLLLVLHLHFDILIQFQ